MLTDALPTLTTETDAQARQRQLDWAGQIAAIDKSQAVIEFDLDGTIRRANQNFLDAVGYRLDEIRGRHHGIFVDDAYRTSGEYRQFWQRLNAGEYVTGEFKRFGKGGREVWIQASYNPILGEDGRPTKVVKYASDVTAAKIKTADDESQLAALSKSQAVIQFNLDGTILTANDNFLAAVGYRLEEIKGRHHSLFVDPGFAAGPEYRQFWADLNAGRFQSGQYKRYGRGGREVWIQAAYNPIVDPSGRVTKVVKFATDITAAKQLEAEVREARVREQQQAKELNERIDSILAVVNAAAKGDLTQEIGVVGNDAIGRMGDGLSKFLGELRGTIGRIAENARSVGGSSEELSAVSTQMNGNAQETSLQASVVSAASEEVSRNVQTVATAAEEMTASIREIARNAADAAKIATSAVKVAEKTNGTIAKLGESSVEIGKVIKVITTIAQQTNLLALNATIEAARAGEAGKGFAVVANEVKELAKATAKATEDISQKIEAIRSDTKESVDAIGQVGQIINQINDISNTIASAVEEQTATTNEMTRNITGAAKGSSEITVNITGVATAAKSTTGGAANTARAAASLAQTATELQTAVSKFRI